MNEAKDVSNLTDFMTMHEFAKSAKDKLSIETWDYLIGGAYTETTLKRNRQSLDNIAFRPRVLNNVESVDASVELFGHKLRLPVIMAPIGSVQDFVEGGGVVPTKAAARFGCYHMLSSVCKPYLEAVAESVKYPKIYQLYVRGDAKWVDDHIDRAIASGYVAFCFTVDLDYYSKRERDVAKRYLSTSRKTQASGEEWQKRFNWNDIKRIRSKYDIPLIIKGIATAEDASKCVEYGIDAVYISNHGGRQLDHGRGGVDVLPEIVKAVNGEAKIIFDGGIMRGADLVKAMIMGADCVGIGRLQGLAAGAAGEDGIVRMLELLEEEAVAAMGMLGVTNWEQLDMSYLHGATEVIPAHVLSAFPLLDEGY